MYLQWLEVCMMQANVLPNQNWIHGGGFQLLLHTSKVFSEHLFQRKRV